ncbi:MAG: hypothetical protein R6U04_12045 [Bacteroidales bacterium]
MHFIERFSKYNRDSKVALIGAITEKPEYFTQALTQSRYRSSVEQQKLESFSENTIANYHLPYGIAPNFLVDGKVYHIPMVIEESSVVAAAAKSAKFWYFRGGFQTESISVSKKGQIHFFWYGNNQEIKTIVQRLLPELKESLRYFTSRMEERGGGIKSIQLNDRTSDIPHYFELDFTIETADSMGANFINSLLEKAAQYLQESLSPNHRNNLEINMAILSNHTPDSKITMKVECPISMLDDVDENMKGEQFARKFCNAVEISKKNISRAVTHNKGIMNGIDSVVMATGNDYRAVEGAAHAYAVQEGNYTSLTECNLSNELFTYCLSIPLSVGSVGGLTNLHPLAKQSLEILHNPSAKELMKIIAAAGLANNFGAIKSLITTGIQKGHMKLHLENILMNFNIQEEKKVKVRKHFQNKPFSYRDIESYINSIT